MSLTPHTLEQTPSLDQPVSTRLVLIRQVMLLRLMPALLQRIQLPQRIRVLMVSKIFKHKKC